MTTFFKSMLLGTAILLSTNIAAQNPIIQTRYTSDPAAVVVGDTVYLFTSHDNGVREGFDMTEWMLYKSADMVNWTDCGAIASLKNFGPWANTADNGAWAAQAIQRDNRWYMYCPIQMRGIGMLTATSPRGPWTDPLKKALINPSYGRKSTGRTSTLPCSSTMMGRLTSTGVTTACGMPN